MLSGNDDWNNKIEQRCYNHELGCCIKSSFACSNIHEQPPSIRQAVYNMLKHDWIILLFYQSCSIMLTVPLQDCWANNPVIACDIFTRVQAYLKLLFIQDFVRTQHPLQFFISLLRFWDISVCLICKLNILTSHVHNDLPEKVIYFFYWQTKSGTWKSTCLVLWEKHTHMIPLN